LSQSFRFLRPVRAGDTVTASVEITAIRADKRIVTLQTVCRNEAGETVLDGEAVLLVEG
jgi:3-hydroxybutyryl-CoA dehydratase